MKVTLKLTQWSMGMRDGVVGDVLVGVGDEVQAGAPLIGIEAEKVSDQITAPVDGRVTAIHVQAGDTVPVGAELITIESGP